MHLWQASFLIFTLLSPLNAAPISLIAQSSLQIQQLLADVASRFSFSSPEDRLLDFSFAGYRAGASPLPGLATNASYFLQPTGDNRDRTQDLQDAIDAVAALPSTPDESPHVVLLAAGTYILSSSKSLDITGSNVILQGDFSTFPSPTVLRVEGHARCLINVGYADSLGSTDPDSPHSTITEDYVPLGATQADVDDPSGFAIGQSVVLRRQVTKEWVETMQMNKLVRNGKHQTWLANDRNIDQEREITSITNRTISWSVPLSDPINQILSSNRASIVAYTAPQRISNIGLSHLTFIRSPSASSAKLTTNPFMPVSFNAVQDGFLSHVHATGFTQFVRLGPASRRITLADFTIVRDKPTADRGHRALPIDVTLGGTQALVLRGRTEGGKGTDTIAVATVTLAPGPNVVSGFTAAGEGKGQHLIQPHERWSTGLLVENTDVGQILMTNRKILGSGQGWTMGTGVVWNSQADRIEVQDPPTSRNFAFSSTSAQGPSFDADGRLSSDPTQVSVGTDVNLSTPSSQGPSSLYELQLAARVGAEAAKAVIAARDASGPYPSNRRR